MVLTQQPSTIGGWPSSASGFFFLAWGGTWRGLSNVALQLVAACRQRDQPSNRLSPDPSRHEGHHLVTQLQIPYLGMHLHFSIIIIILVLQYKSSNKCSTLIEQSTIIFGLI